jgi:tetratricopeptide (TPR) repeat protein
MAVPLDRIDWERALEELRRLARERDGGASRRRLADASSLSALFEGDHRVGAARIADAIRLEPLNPLHHVRKALHALRFGAWELSLTAVDVVNSVSDPPHPQLIRALATLQSGEERRAGNIARDLYAAHPAFHLAGFLQAEAQIRGQLKEAEGRAQSLPRDPAWATAWAHLLGRFIVTRPAESAKVVKQHLEVRPAIKAGSAEEAAVRKLHRLSTAGAEALERELEVVPAGSRAEELAIEFLSEALRAVDKDHSRLRALRRMHERAPQRAAVRRLYVSALTRYAVDEAVAERWPAALRAVEVCIRLEPHQAIHLQNRAAIVTATADDAYHDAWEALDRHHYRLALMGRLDGASVRSMMKPHRMFASQARLTPKAGDVGIGLDLGVFAVKEERERGVTSKSLVVNQARLDADPEQLRQWIHHRRAELVFAHLALGPDPDRHLLFPGDPRVERARIEGLIRGADSLETLIPEEGRRLADVLAARWRSFAGRTRTRYGDAAPDDAEVAALARRHVETFADLALVLWTYLPAANRPDIVDELLDFQAAVAPFFDARVLRAMRRDQSSSAPTALGFLGAILRQTLEVPEEQATLTEAQRLKLTNRLAAELLITLASRKLEAARSLGPNEVEQLMTLVDRARKLDGESAKVECWAARLLTMGEFFDEARAAIARFHRVSGGKDNPFQKHVEELQRILDEKKKAKTAGRKRSGAAATVDDGGRGERTERLEEQVERFPTSIPLYEELARSLCFEGRFSVALTWTGLAIGRCLSRQPQLRARALQLEVTGLAMLAAQHAEAPRIYLAGSRAAALEAIEAMAARTPELPYAVEYLRGVCLLAAKRRDEAQTAFQAALARCPQQLYRAVLKPLAEDVEVALLEQARRAIEQAQEEGRLGDAITETAAAMSELRAPEACLVDLARVALASVVLTLGTGTEPLALPAPAIAAPWGKRLAAIRAEPDGLRRARGLATLAAELHEGSKRDAEALLRKIEALEGQLALAAALSESAKLAERGQIAEALATLDRADAGKLSDPRADRQRVVLLLRLERFAEADAVVEKLRAGDDSRARELLERYPELRFRAQLSVANRLIRGGDAARARVLLDEMKPATPDQALEHAYCLGFCLAQQGYRCDDDGDRTEARRLLERALGVVEEQLPEARKKGHARLIELHDKLDGDVARL